MPSLKQAVAEKKAQEPTLRRNPEIDAKLDRFIAENPDLREYYEKLSKDELIRKLMLGKSSAFRRVNETRPRMTIAVITIRMKTGREMATRVRPILAGAPLGTGFFWQRPAGTVWPWQDGDVA